MPDGAPSTLRSGLGVWRRLTERVRAQVESRVVPVHQMLDSTATLEQSSQALHTRLARLEGTLDRLDLTEFDNIAALLSDPARRLHLLGGRITRSNAHYFFNHLQIIRPQVTLLDSSPSAWPQALLDMDARSVLIIFDIRRYERELERLATLAVDQGATIVLFTDAWGSPIERCAAHTIRAMVEVPSAWDSTLAINFIVEALVAEVQTRCSDMSAERIAALEDMIGESRIFRGT